MSYYSLVVYEIQMAAIETPQEPQQPEERFHPQSIALGYNENQSVYFIAITFASALHPENQVTERVEFKKIVKPFCHWLVFVMARQRGNGLEHSDMAIIKFRMLSLWNKEAERKLIAEDVFDINNFAVSLKFQAEHISILGKNYLFSRFVIRDTFKAFLENFFPELDAKTLKSIKANPDEMEQWVSGLFDLKD